MVDQGQKEMVTDQAVSLSHPSLSPYGALMRSVMNEPGAAFLEFHEPLAAFLHPDTVGPSKNDTLLASGEVYNNWVRMDVWYRSDGPSN